MREYKITLTRKEIETIKTACDFWILNQTQTDEWLWIRRRNIIENIIMNIEQKFDEIFVNKRRTK